ncbi:MAG: c-type cytochrome [Verrucomicrobiota bacterium]
MKLQRSAASAAALMVVAGSLVSCGGPAKTASDSEKTEPAHPWDWTPEDPTLLEGKEVYRQECALCHNEGEEGAPRLNEPEEWAKRSEKGIDAMVRKAIEGFIGPDGEMPARGGSDYLTDEEMASAVEFMVAASEQALTN